MSAEPTPEGITSTSSAPTRPMPESLYRSRSPVRGSAFARPSAPIHVPETDESGTEVAAVDAPCSARVDVGDPQVVELTRVRSRGRALVLVQSAGDDPGPGRSPRVVLVWLVVAQNDVVRRAGVDVDGSE